MKLLSTLATATAALLFSAGVAFSQTVEIGDPVPGTQATVKAGNKFTFRLDSHNVPSAHPTELGISFGLVPACGQDCHHNFSKDLGHLFPKASFSPKVDKNGPTTLPYQIFTVKIPADTLKGPAALGIKRESIDGKQRRTELLRINLIID